MGANKCPGNSSGHVYVQVAARKTCNYCTSIQIYDPVKKVWKLVK